MRGGKIARNAALATSIAEGLRLAWSPEQIAGHARMAAGDAKVSQATIYQYVYSPEGRRQDLWRHLPRARKNRRRRYARKPRGLNIPLANTIAERPAEIGSRASYGHWEGDLVAFRKEFGKANLTSLVERRSRFIVLIRNPSRHSCSLIAIRCNPFGSTDHRDEEFTRRQLHVSGSTNDPPFSGSHMDAGGEFFIRNQRLFLMQLGAASCSRVTIRGGLMEIALAQIAELAAPQIAERSAEAAGQLNGGEAVIVVTAQPRAGNSRPIPLAMTFIPASELERAHVQSIFDIARVTPGLQVRMGAITSSVQMNIRGLGAAANTAIEPSVATFIDGVYVPRGGSVVATFLDLAGGEVLRGPQGTLFGRNASVGALSLFTAQPQPDAGAQFSQEIGNGNRFSMGGVVNLPLGEGTAIRVAGLSQLFGGYWHNRLDGKRYGGKDEAAMRGSFKFARGPVEWILRADYARAAGDGFVGSDLDSTSISSGQLGNLRTILGGQLPDANLHDTTVNQVVTARLVDEQWGGSSRVSLALGSSQLLLVSGYRHWQNNQTDGDSALMPISLLSRGSAHNSRSTSQELQYTSPGRQWLGGRLDVVAGLYFSSDEFEIGEKLYLGSQACNLLLSVANGSSDACNGLLAAGNGNEATDQKFRQTTTSLAAYGQANVYLTGRLSASFGARWTRDTKRGSYDQRVGNPFAIALRAPETLQLPEVRGSNVSATLRFNYTPTARSLIFAGYSTGYKSGGYNSGGGGVSLSSFDAAGALIATRRTFRAETVTDMHVGVKVAPSHTGVSGSLVFYRMDVHDYQDRAVLGTTFLLGNSGDLRQQGIELEGHYSPFPKFKVLGSLSYLDSRFLSFPNAPGLPGLGGVQDLAGKRARFSPKWSGMLTAIWQDRLGGTGMGWELSANATFASAQYLGSATDANPQSIEPGYALLGARFSVEGLDHRWTASLFTDNLTNRRYAHFNANQVFDGLFGLRNGIFPGSTAIRKLSANPRTYGIAVKFRFGDRTKD